jgi:hypothetical protein
MDEAIGATPAAPVRALPSPISYRELWPWALIAIALLLLLFFVGLDEGAISLVPGRFVHEFLHDGRHLLAVPCH